MNSEELLSTWHKWIALGLGSAVLCGVSVIAAAANYPNVGLVFLGLGVAWFVVAQLKVTKYRKLTNAAWASERQKRREEYSLPGDAA